MWNILLSTFRKQSLLNRLIMSFLLVIVCLAAFQFLSFSFFKKKVQQEIVKFSSLNLKYAAESYEKNLELIDTTIATLYFDEKMSLIMNDRSAGNFKILNLFASQLQRHVSGGQLYADDIVVYFGDTGTAISKEGIRSIGDLTSIELISDAYPASFWEEQVSNAYRYKWFPAAEFKRRTLDKQIVSRGEQFPIIYKNSLNPQMYFLVLLDARQTFKAFYRGIQDDFYIVNEEGDVLFHTDPSQLPEKKDLQAFASADEGNWSQGSNLHFYTKGKHSGLIYVSVVPNSTITAQLQQMNIVLLVILGAAVIVGIAISVFLSWRFHHPVQQIIKLIQKPNEALPTGSSINEFNIISGKIGDMMVINEEISNDLSRQNSIIKKYNYINKMKRIYSSYDKVEEDLLESGNPFYLVLYSMTFTNKLHKFSPEDQTRGIYYMDQFIQRSLMDDFPDAVTIQIEKDQILSLVFVKGHEQKDELLANLQGLKTIFDRDKDYCLVTIASDLVLRDSTEFTTAYEETLEMLQLRKMVPGTQLIVEPVPESAHVLRVPSLDQEFAAHLQAGNETAIQTVDRLLRKLAGNEANLYQFTHLSREIIAAVMKALTAANIDADAMPGKESPYEKLKTCAVAEDYFVFFHEFLEASLYLIREKKAVQEPLKDSILNYIHRNYHKDISLETVADKFNLSSGYLSLFFKEKTQTNFLYYLNELRVNKAKELLLETNMKVHDIGEQVGFQSANSFIRLFKKFTGIPPGAFRRMNHKLE